MVSIPLVVIKCLSDHFNLHLLIVRSGSFPWGYPTSLMCCPEHHQVGHDNENLEREAFVGITSSFLLFSFCVSCGLYALRILWLRSWEIAIIHYLAKYSRQWTCVVSKKRVRYAFCFKIIKKDGPLEQELPILDAFHPTLRLRILTSIVS